jgi:hypothetical protein
MSIRAVAASRSSPPQPEIPKIAAASQRRPRSSEYSERHQQQAGAVEQTSGRSQQSSAEHRREPEHDVPGIHWRKPPERSTLRQSQHTMF